MECWSFVSVLENTDTDQFSFGPPGVALVTDCSSEET
jgi:hypothetical protein